MIVNDNANGKVTHVTDSTWQTEVIEASKIKPVYVDFWAEWCGPCKMFAPVIDKVALDMSDQIKFTKIDTDSNPIITQKFMVMAIPTSLIFINGEVSFQQSGMMPESKFREILAAEAEKMKANL